MCTQNVIHLKKITLKIDDFFSNFLVHCVRMRVNKTNDQDVWEQT